MSKHIYIAYTGGTIGMRGSEAGYETAVGYLQEQMAQMPELYAASMPRYTVGEFDPLLDSANMTPSDWLHIAKDIESKYDDYDGFVVLHGTDTMAYTSSALAFMLHNLEKPVIVTGSQIPLCRVRNDARENLITSLQIAANHSIPEVCLYFGNRLLRGCRATKVSSSGLRAFDSPNYPPLAKVGIDVSIDWRAVLPAPPQDTKFIAEPMAQESIGALRLFPGISPDLLRNILKDPLEGLVLEAYGVGNGPTRDLEFLEVLREATARGVVIVDCTQCLSGSVDLDGYMTGSALKDAGVIGGVDMTAEAALAKLFYLFSAGLRPSEVCVEMTNNLRGELTSPNKTRSVF